ncbi:MAG TPA: hypothetical protein VJ499_02100 [Flavisolibacter sp.]|nr:hypothetical protein [Flavisolibacter sp.]
MKKVTLIFTTPYNLWQFKQYVRASSCEVNLAKMTLTCFCSDADIELAIRLFHAKEYVDDGQQYA